MNNTCYLAFITQAICANFAPLLFLRFHTNYGISLGQIALIPTAFFRSGILVGSIFPLILIISLFLMDRKKT